MSQFQLINKINSLGSFQRSSQSISTHSHTYKVDKHHQDYFKYNNLQKQIYCQNQSQLKDVLDWLKQQQQDDEQTQRRQQQNKMRIDGDEYSTIKCRIKGIDDYRISLSKNKQRVNEQQCDIEIDDIEQMNEQRFKNWNKQGKIIKSLKQKKVMQVKKQENVIKNGVYKCRRNKIFSNKGVKQQIKQMLKGVKQEMSRLREQNINNKKQIIKSVQSIKKQKQNNLSQTPVLTLYRKLIITQQQIHQQFHNISQLNIHHLIKQKNIIKKIITISLQFNHYLHQFKPLSTSTQLQTFINKNIIIQNSISLVNFIIFNYQILKHKQNEFEQFIKDFCSINVLQKLIKLQYIIRIYKQFNDVKQGYIKKGMKVNVIGCSKYREQFKNFIQQCMKQIQQLNNKEYDKKRQEYIIETKQKIMQNKLSQSQKFKIYQFFHAHHIPL